MNTVFIYALNDPTTGRTRYIGKAKDPYQRYESHMGHIHWERDTHKAKWIRSLISKNQAPILEILDEVPEHEWQFWEREWIKLYHVLLFDLTNGTDGGEGCCNPSKETREKVAAAKRGIPRSPEARAKMSATRKGKYSGCAHPWWGRKHSPESIEKIRLAKRGKPLPPRSKEWYAKWGALRRGEKNVNFGKKISAERNVALQAGSRRAHTGRKQSSAEIAKRQESRRKNAVIRGHW